MGKFSDNMNKKFNEMFDKEFSDGLPEGLKESLFEKFNEKMNKCNEDVSKLYYMCLENLCKYVTSLLGDNFKFKILINPTIFEILSPGCNAFSLVEFDVLEEVLENEVKIMDIDTRICYSAYINFDLLT